MQCSRVLQRGLMRRCELLLVAERALVSTAAPEMPITNGDSMLDTKLVTRTLAIWSAVSFVVCVIYGVITPQSFHTAALLEQELPGFTWLTAQGFMIGLVESFLYGVFAGVTFCPIYNLVRHVRAGRPVTRG